MSKIQLLCVTMIAVFASSMSVIAASAAGTTFLLGEWLVNGSAVTISLSAKMEGEVSLEDTNVFKLNIKAKALCSIIFDGTVSPNGAAEFAELLSLSGTGISLTPLTGISLSCTDQENCVSPEVWAVNMPWHILLELIEQGSFVSFAALILSSTAGKPGWYVDCTVMGVVASDECLVEAESAAEAKSIMGGVEAIFTEPFMELTGLKLALCTSSGETSGIVEGKGLISTTEVGTTLAVSSEG